MQPEQKHMAECKANARGNAFEHFEWYKYITYPVAGWGCLIIVLSFVPYTFCFPFCFMKLAMILKDKGSSISGCTLCTASSERLFLGWMFTCLHTRLAGSMCTKVKHKLCLQCSYLNPISPIHPGHGSILKPCWPQYSICCIPPLNGSMWLVLIND